MNSIAIWYEKNATTISEDIPELELHLNHWKLKTKNSLIDRVLQIFRFKGNYLPNDYFIDFGIKILRGESVSKVFIYIPFEYKNGIERKNIIEDLGVKLRDRKLITAVFNEPYTTQDLTNTQKAFSVNKDDKNLFNIYELDVENDINIDYSKYKGTIFSFDFRQFKSIPTYYRFRLKGQFVKNLSYVYKPSISFLESAFSSVEIIDFRINDTRNLNVSLVEQIEECSKFNISLVHYFVMRNVKDEYILSNQALNSVRQLEENVWSTYISESEHLYEKSFAYHLKKKVNEEDKASKRYIDEFSAVLKFRFEDSKLFMYFIYLLIFAMFTEVLGSGLYDCLKPILKVIVEKGLERF